MRITKYLIGGLAALALVGCKDKMRELNSNPETIGETDPRYMFMNAMMDLDYGRGNVTNSFSSEGRMMQYFVSYDGASESTYSTVGRYSAPGQIGNNYSSLYSVGYKMVLLQNYIDVNLSEAQAAEYKDLHAIAGIAKVYEAFRVFQNYGAAVYSDGFKAITEGITTPTYDIFSNEVYESLDDELAGYIAVLEQKNENQTELGIYDPIYGYVVNVGMGAPEARGDYDEQRTLWTKFGNSYRLYMAWIMKAADPARFTQVLTDTKGKWFETAADGAYSYQNGPGYNGTPYNSNDVSAISVTYAMSDNFISYLKELDDPRLPLLARANGLYADNKDIQWIQHYFPDTLEKWKNEMDFANDADLAYQGISANPADRNKAAQPGKFWNQRTFTFRFHPDGWKAGDTENNDKLAPWKATNKGEITKEFPAEFEIKESEYSISVEVGSRPQGRYFVSCGGRSFGDATNNAGNGYDGSVANWGNIYFRHPLYTYPEFCFMMAYLSSENVETGTPAADWFKSGVTAAMEELQADAIRYGVQVATNTASTYEDIVVNPKIVGVNETKVYNITSEIASYVDGLTISPEAIVGQMWIYAYNQPIKMWDWWRVTGYPKIVEVATPAEAAQVSGPYWVQPQRSAAEAGMDNNLEFPRRGALPQPKAINNDNYNAARDELMTQPNYGPTYGATTGRIYWDVQGL